MEIGMLVLEYIRVLVWPVILVTGLVLFRDELGATIRRVRKLKLPGGGSLDLGQEIQEAKDLLPQVEKQMENTPALEGKRKIPMAEANARMLELGLRPSPSGLDLSYYRNLATQDPNLALAGLRIEYDIITRNLADGWNVEFGPRDSGVTVLQKLRDSDAITSEQMRLSQKVFQLCDSAIHGAIISLTEANEVIEVAGVLRDQYLRWLSWGFEGDRQHSEDGL